MNHTATHKADSQKCVHINREYFRNTHRKRAMGCPWGEGQHGCGGSHLNGDSVIVKTWADIFVSQINN